MKTETVFVEFGADFGEEDDKGETAFQFDEEDKGEPPIKKRHKIQAQRLIKRAVTCKSPFVNNYVQKFHKIPIDQRLVVDYTLSEYGNLR